MNGRYAAKRLAVGIMSACLVSMLVLGGVPGTSYDGAVGESDAIALTSAAAVAVGGAIAGGGTYAALEFLDSDEKSVATDGSTAEEVQSSIYSSAGTVNQGSDTITETQSVLNDKGQNFVFAEAKSEIVEAHEDGEAESVAKEKARQVVKDEYLSQQEAVLNRMETLSNEINGTIVTVRQTSNLSIDDVFSQPSDTVSSFNQPGTYSYTLINGSDRTVLNPDWSGSLGDDLYPDGHLQVKSPDSNLDDQTLANGSRFVNLLNEIDSQHQSTVSNVETFASDLYSNYSPGEVNASEFLSPEQVASQYGLGSQNGSGYALANAAMMGYPTNATASVTIRYESTGNTADGGLFAENNPPTTIPNGTAPAWVTGETYVPSSQYSKASNYVNGSVYLADDSGSWNEIESNFSIVSQTDAGSGENLSYAQTRQYTDLNTDASDVSKSLQNLEAALDERELDAGGGGGFFGGGGEGPLGISWIVWLFAGVLVLALATRDG